MMLFYLGNTYEYMYSLLREKNPLRALRWKSSFYNYMYAICIIYTETNDDLFAASAYDYCL